MEKEEKKISNLVNEDYMNTLEEAFRKSLERKDEDKEKETER